MRIPQCVCANWGAEGKEKEAFLLIVEKFDSPDWVQVDPELGCNYEQAMTAAETLGRMHKEFTSRQAMQELDWLPYTIADVRNAANIQSYFSFVLHWDSVKRLVNMLPPGAQDAVERLAEGGLEECLERLSEPPLTLNHGDYRPENLRFSAPGRPPAVGVFDWGSVNRSKGIADFAYFVMTSMKPEDRRKRDRELLLRYLQARGEGEKQLESSWEELRSASLVVLGLILLGRQGMTGDLARVLVGRMLRWVGEAITDWNSIELIQ